MGSGSEGNRTRMSVAPNAYEAGLAQLLLQREVEAFYTREAELLDDRRFTVNADVYYIKWTDIQQVLSLSCGYPYDTNAGNAKSYGPEVELSAIIVPGLTFDLSGTKTMAYISDPSASAIASARSRTNRPPSSAPLFARSISSGMACPLVKKDRGLDA